MSADARELVQCPEQASGEPLPRRMGCTLIFPQDREPLAWQQEIGHRTPGRDSLLPHTRLPGTARWKGGMRGIPGMWLPARTGSPLHRDEGRGPALAPWLPGAPPVVQDAPKLRAVFST